MKPGLVSTSLSASTPSGTDPWRPRACLQSLWVYMCTGPAVYSGPCFLGVLYPLWLLKSSCPSTALFPEMWEEGFDEDIPFSTECFKVSHSLYIVQLWVSAFDPICCRTWPVCMIAEQDSIRRANLSGRMVNGGATAPYHTSSQNSPRISLPLPWAHPCSFLVSADERAEQFSVQPLFDTW